jgi:maltose alpha-D-glucosyltransferase/alpha-amylase
MTMDTSLSLGNDSFWYKDAIIYQLHVRSFHDSDGDGIGDFRGLTRKLDYLEDLGVTAIWLLPFYPSPLKDDGYDISDYTTIHPSYGTTRDFNRFLREAHRRGLRVITELVINHTSDQHPWFQRARRAPKESVERNFYVWSDTPDKYKGVRIIFKDFEMSNWSLDAVAGSYYWHRFYSHQPDLNYDNPEVKKTIFRLMDLWMNRGIDGLRLDAIPYLYEREGTSCENLSETHLFLKELRKHIDDKYRNKMLLAEANMWPEDAVAYFGQDDECHMAFHFPIMPRMFMAIRMENRFPIIDILDQTPAIPEKAQWAMFLRNHDELTLEMVTDRERDYMYQVYARDREMRINLGIRRRLAPLLGNDRRAIELMNCLLLSFPGTPVIYYGDEIGMGDNVFLGDRNGVRTPMQWSADRNAGFSRANPQRLYLPIILDPEYHYEAVNVETQQKNPRSFLWWMKHIIGLRKQFKAFGRGSIEFLKPENPRILAYIREYGDECIIVVANLSRFAQSANLDLSRFRGKVPVELFGQNKFPPVAEVPYLMTLGPYAFFWFSLVPQQIEVHPLAAGVGSSVPSLKVQGTWENILKESNKNSLEKLLPGYLKECRWFGGKARGVDSATIVDDIHISFNNTTAHLLLIRIEYVDGTQENYTLPVAFASDEKAEKIKSESSTALIAFLKTGAQEGFLYDALWDEDFSTSLLEAISRRRRFSGEHGMVITSTTPTLRHILKSSDGIPRPHIPQIEQSNTSVFYNEKLILKLIRRLEPGVNPDLEIGRFLTEVAHFPYIPPLAGAIEYHEPNREPATIAVLQGFVENQGNAWQYTLDYLNQYYERGVARAVELEDIPLSPKSILDSLNYEPPPVAKELFGMYMQQANLLGQRTAEFHLALASNNSEPNFAPESFTEFYKQSHYQSMRGLATEVFRMLRNHLAEVPEAFKEVAQHTLDLEKVILTHFRPIRDKKLTSMRIRTHGDYHLGQVLYTGKDFVLIDFEGEPARSLSERRNKMSPLRDVAGMLRSFHYASFAAAFALAKSAVPVKLNDMEPWGRLWYTWTSIAFLKGYIETSKEANFIPSDVAEFKTLLEVYTLEKALYELSYELNHRPDWIGIPLQGILEIMQSEL